MQTTELGLCLHAGARIIEPDKLTNLPTPVPTETHVPVAHAMLRWELQDALMERGWTVAREENAVWKDGARYFAVFGLKNGHDDEGKGYGMVVGLRNSHDKSFQVAICLGERVFVCDNLAFHAQVVVKTKHTRKIRERLPSLIGAGVNKLFESEKVMEARNEAYASCSISHNSGSTRLLRLHERGVLKNNAVKPAYEAWVERTKYDSTVWGLKNVLTRVTQDTRPVNTLPMYSARIHDELDLLCGFQPESVKIEVPEGAEVN